ncbi:VanZ family protein [Lactobacillus delbrueckii]|uniref:VanZ family protein n=1 Tax=Lactobacillus delbrueckii TaxID=1584 RepID=UPI0039C87B74
MFCCLFSIYTRIYTEPFFLGVLSSVTIEILQFLLMTGVSDIDDVFFNACGVLLGYGLYFLLGQICVKNPNKD